MPSSFALRRSLGSIVLLSLLTATPALAASQAAIDASIKRAAGYLIEHAANPARMTQGTESLILYALVKGKIDKNSPSFQNALKKVLGHFTTDGEYEPKDYTADRSTYTAGLDAMTLSEIDANTYAPELRGIRNFLLARQLPSGGFNYTGTGRRIDISVSQYGMLGYWAVRRAGLPVPDKVWHLNGRMHIAGQSSAGGWPYAIEPGRPVSSATLNMTAAGIGSIQICKLYLGDDGPDEADLESDAAAVEAARKKELEEAGVVAAVDIERPPVRYGILYPVERAKPPEPEVTPQAEIAEKKALERLAGVSAKTSKSSIDKASAKALEHLEKVFVVDGPPGRWNSYYYYALERAATLTNVETIRGVDWFEACSDHIIKKQNPNGSWSVGYDAPIDTAFLLLFLSRSTQSIVGKPVKKSEPTETFGGGLLIGGRGLPKDLSKYGQPLEAMRKIETPLEQLLEDLANADADSLPDLQKKLVEQVQLGDHAELIGQSERLVAMSKSKDANLRRIAAWSMGRTGELALARHVLPMFDDPSPAVLTEVRNAMTWIARRPDGYGLDEFPPGDEAALQQWRNRAWTIWGNWYFDQSLYGERLDEFELDLRRRLDTIRGIR